MSQKENFIRTSSINDNVRSNKVTDENVLIFNTRISIPGANWQVWRSSRWDQCWHGSGRESFEGRWWKLLQDRQIIQSFILSLAWYLKVWSIDNGGLWQVCKVNWLNAYQEGTDKIQGKVQYVQNSSKISLGRNTVFSAAKGLSKRRSV